MAEWAKRRTMDSINNKKDKTGRLQVLLPWKNIRYFSRVLFILANFDIQPVSALRRHSAFIDFVKFGGEIKPVNKDIVDGLMKIYPDPVLNPGAREELNAASSIWLTKAQYQYLLRMENTLQPESRISLLLELVSNAEHHGFMERLVNIP